MKEGLYRAEFATEMNSGSGVVFLRDGQIRGGDSAMYYVGAYALDGDVFRGQICAVRHTVGLDSVFGLNQVDIEFSGSFLGDTATVTGAAKAVPGVEFQAILSFLAE